MGLGCGDGQNQIITEQKWRSKVLGVRFQSYIRHSLAQLELAPVGIQETNQIPGLSPKLWERLGVIAVSAEKVFLDTRVTSSDEKETKIPEHEHQKQNFKRGKKYKTNLKSEDHFWCNAHEREDTESCSG